jgi:DNA adenine methylase
MHFTFPSPLRYPGGKTPLKTFLARTIELNQIVGGTYIEPYAGGAGAALSLLFGESVSKIYINDKDPHIYSFWKAVLHRTEEFLDLLDKTPVNVATWKKQRSILHDPKIKSFLKIGFATFYLNRCNRSGVLNGGPIGGLHQNGNYSIDARFNRNGLMKRIEKIGLFRERIRVSNKDGVTFLKSIFRRGATIKGKALVYMDPPFFKKAQRLYSFYFKEADHQRLAKYLNGSADFRWVMSYDDTAHVRRLYSGTRKRFLKGYSINSVRVGRELIFASENCSLPHSIVG